MDVVPLEDPADVGPIRRADAEPLDGGLPVSERVEEGEGKLPRIERLVGDRGDSLLNFYGIHRSFQIRLDDRGPLFEDGKLTWGKGWGSVFATAPERLHGVVVLHGLLMAPLRGLVADQPTLVI